ncbi:MAG: Gfo/Idh/MocA family oxidoreductase [Microlunatus sp.]|nr:Gfo/Idh/MocA family oxidoreductase [Microlunatus sp.]
MITSSHPTGRPRVGFVGTGMVADLHHQAILTRRALELVGFVETDDRRAADRSEEWKVDRYPDLDALLPAVDAVLVLTPERTHHQLASRCLDAGKHVLVEKPVGDADEIADLAGRADRAGLVCMPGHNYAYQPEFTELRSLINSGSFGRVRALWITYVIKHPEDVAAHYAGVLEEVMVHHSYLTLALLGRPARIHAGRMEPAWHRHRADDQAWMTWEYPGGTSAHLFATFAVDDDTSDPWTFQVKVLGDRGGGLYNWRDTMFSRPLGTLPYALPAYEASYGHEHAAFAAAIRDEPLVSPLSDAGTAAMILNRAKELSTDPEYGAILGGGRFLPAGGSDAD